MDELEISGKRYISTRRAAREHGYHSDYMGQLIRGKKVVGQKVGRAWYIEEDSLNVYLGKAPAAAPAPKVAPVPAADVAPAVVERLVVEEPAPAVPEPAEEVVMPGPVVVETVEQIIKEEAQPIAVRVEPQTSHPIYAQPVQEIHHAPIERHETRIPIHTPAYATQEAGGLRYTADDAPSIPVVMRTSAHFNGMPQIPQAAQYQVPQATHAPRTASRFPYVSLSVVGVVAILAATFASNFVSATIVSEEGKAATIQYAIHW